MKKHTYTFFGYGNFPGGDPRDFSPDHECSTEEERKAHKEACEQWENGIRESKADCLHFPGIILTRCQFGLGGYEIKEECEDDACKDCDVEE